MWELNNYVICEKVPSPGPDITEATQLFIQSKNCFHQKHFLYVLKPNHPRLEEMDSMDSYYHSTPNKFKTHWFSISHLNLISIWSESKLFKKLYKTVSTMYTRFQLILFFFLSKLFKEW